MALTPRLRWTSGLGPSYLTRYNRGHINPVNALLFAHLAGPFSNRDVILCTMRRLVCGLVCSLVVACGGGGSGSSSTGSQPPPISAQPPPTPPSPAPPPIQEVTGLQTDEQLRTVADANAGTVDEDAALWFSANAQIIRSLTEVVDFSDLRFLEGVLASKRIVALGESSHGVREYSQAKLRLIRYLHEELGYNVLAFESGIFDCEEAQRLLATSSARRALNACLFGVWQTQTVLELFEYVQSTQSTDSPLRITGFDTQISGAAFESRAPWTASLVRAASTSYAEEVLALEERYYELALDVLQAESSNDPALSRVNAEREGLSSRYLVLADYLEANIESITAGSGASREDVLIASQYARSSPRYLEQLGQRFTRQGGSLTRDRGMAENLIALAQNIYPEDKIIVWAHNAHLRHDGAGFLPGANMGSFVHEELAEQLYTIGFYMYRGSHAFNNRAISPVQPPLDLSLEATFYQRRLAWLFVDLEGANEADPGADWLARTISTWTWGSSEVGLILRDEYSGLFVIDSVSPPAYL